MTHTLAWIALLTLAPLAAAADAPVVDVDMVIGSSAENGGQLLLSHDFSRPVVVTESVRADGLTRFTSTQPGFETVLTPRPGLWPLRNATPVRMEIVRIEAPVSFKLGADVIDDPGQSVVIGSSPSLHMHGEWRLLLPDGEVGAFTLTYRLTSTSPAYTASPEYTFHLTNDPAFVPPSTTTTLPGAGGTTQALSGKQLRLRPASLTARSTDRALQLGADVVPDTSGGTLRIVGSGDAPFDVVHPLPSGGWRALGGAAPGWRYRDRTGAAGPVRKLVVRPGRGLELALKGPLLGHSLQVEATDVTVVVALGDARYCMTFGGAGKWKPGKLLTRTNAPAGSCPSAPMEAP